MDKLRGLRTDESGQVVPLFAMMLVLLVGIAAIALDGAQVYQLKNTTYNIAEVSALSASHDLKWGEADDRAKDTAIQYALENGAKADHVQVTTEYNQPADGSKRVNRVKVEVSMVYPMKLGKMIGIKDRQVTGIYTVTMPVLDD